MYDRQMDEAHYPPAQPAESLAMGTPPPAHDEVRRYTPPPAYYDLPEETGVLLPPEQWVQGQAPLAEVASVVEAEAPAGLGTAERDDRVESLSVARGTVPAPAGLPLRPQSLAETELEDLLVQELVLKHLAAAGSVTGADIAERVHLPLAGVLDEVIDALRRESLIETTSTNSSLYGAAGKRIRLTDRGAQAARLAVERSGYVGPAPVSLRVFERMLREQAMRVDTVTRADVWKALAHLVLPTPTVDRLGAGSQSGGPLLLFGEAGNGKTAVAAALAQMLHGSVFLPHAVLIDGHVLRVYDPSIHWRMPQDGAHSRLDTRWVHCQRPFVRVGAELSLQALDLHFNAQYHAYDCPVQLKAAGGVLLVDDLGSQQERTGALLSRCLAPLATGVDYLTTVTGRRVALPFTPLLVFATGSAPGAILDEALLRRLPCKVEIPNPDREGFQAIFARVCAEAGVEFSQAGYDYLIERCYVRTRRTPRAAHPAELARLLAMAARYFGVRPELMPELIDVVADLYFP